MQNIFFDELNERTFKLEEPMNIHAKKGDMVLVTTGTSNNGSSYDKEKVKKYLVIGSTYIVLKTEIGQSSTSVYLKEVPGVFFNSVNFISIEINYKKIFFWE